MSWTDLSEALSSNSDGADMTANIDDDEYSDWLRLTNFGFTASDIPTGSTILGIEVEIRHGTNTWGSPGDMLDDGIYLRDATGQIGNDKSSVTAWSQDLGAGYDWETFSYGSTSDVWGTTLTPADIHASTFGIDISAKQTPTTSNKGSIDYARIRITYDVDIAVSFTSAAVADASFNTNPVFPDMGGTAGFSCSVEIEDLATSKHRASAASYQVLLEINWPGGSVHRYSFSPFTLSDLSFEGRIVSLGDLVLTEGREVGRLSVSLENVSGVAITDYWTDTDPPENAQVDMFVWFEGDTYGQKLHLFRGFVGEVVSVTETTIDLMVVGAEEGYDKILGAEITTAEFSDAPDESLGKMQPLVFGTVEDHEPVPVTTVARSRLAAPLLTGDTTIDLEDAEDFPSSGTVTILDEELAYTGKTANQLTGVTHAQNSTIAVDYASGTEVVEKGAWELVVAEHAVSAISDVFAWAGRTRRAVDSGDYSTQLTAPGKITFAAGSYPTLLIPTGSLAYLQVQLDDTDGVDNTAINAVFACADHPQWTEQNTAEVDQTNTTLAIVQDDDVEPQGDIVRVWIAVEYDDSPFPLTTDQVDVKLAGGSTLGQLPEDGNLPTAIKNRIGFSLGRAYDDEHAHTVDDGTSGQENDVYGTSVDLNGSSWNNSANLTDSNKGTYGDNVASLPADADFTGFSPTTTGRVPTKIRACVQAGAAGHPDDFEMKLIVGGSVKAQVFVNASTSSAEYCTGWWTPSAWADVTGATVKLDFYGGDHAIYAVWLDVQWEGASSSTAITTQALLHTRTFLAEITTTVDGDWTWFKDSEVQVVFNGSTDTDIIKINRVYYLVAYTPVRKVPADRITCTVQGLQPDGDPVEHLRNIVTDAALMGLSTNEFDQGTMNTVQTSLDALSYALDFAIYNFVRAVDLIALVAEQARILHWWDSGVLRGKFRADISAMSASSSFGTHDIVPGSVVRARTPLNEVMNKLRASYQWNAGERIYDALETSDAANQAVGERKKHIEWTLIRDATTAANLAAHLIERAGIPRFVIEFMVYLPGLDLQLGDIISIDVGQFSYSKVEVVSLRYDLGSDPPTITIGGVVYDTI